ncbi:MAG: hypothetical protein WCA44_05875 [Acidobacteriaceae bacterium]
MTEKEQRDYQQMYQALKRILTYQTPDQLRRSSCKKWGREYEEALEYSYENIQGEARSGLKGVRNIKKAGSVRNG